MKLRILDVATAEYTDAIARYEAIESDLGVRLKQEVGRLLLESQIMLSHLVPDPRAIVA